MRPSGLATALTAIAVAAAGCAGGAGEDAVGDVTRDQAVAAGGGAAPQTNLPTLVEGTLTACVAATPVVAEQTGEDWQGYDIGVLEEVADHLGLALDIVATSVDDIVSGLALNRGDCDLAAGGVVDDGSIDGVARTSAAYRAVHRLVVTLTAIEAVSPVDVRGRVGMEDDGSVDAAAMALTAADVVVYPSRADLSQALANGAVDAVLVPVGALPDLRALTEAEPSVLSAVPTGAETVFLFPLSSDEVVVEAVDGALAGLRDTGRLAALRDAWLRG